MIILQKKQKHGKRKENYIRYSFIHFIGGTVKLHTDDYAGSKKVKWMRDGKTSAKAKFQNVIGKAIFVCPGKNFTSYVPNCTHICRRKRIV